MNQLTRFSLKNAAAIIIISCILFIFGAYSATTLKQEAMPDISLPMVFVSTVYPAPPKDVLEDVTKKLEKRIVGIEGLKKINSTSSDNFSLITVELVNGADTDKAKTDIADAIADVELPSGASAPKVSKFGFGSFPIYFTAMHGTGDTNQDEINRLYEQVVEPTLSAMDGIDHVDGVGQQEATLKLKLDMNALTTYGLTPSDVTQSIQAALATNPAGTVKFNGTSQSVRVESDLNTIYGLENMKISASNGQTLLLKQLAKVEALSDAKYITRLNDQPAIGLTVYKGKDANTVEFAARLDKMIADWEKEYPNIKFTNVYNSATEVKKSVNGMMKEGSIGAIMAAIMILLFLRNVRMTIIVLVSIPLSVLTTLSIMAVFDLSLNIMTLGGLTIAIGRVVDDSIVVIENIYTELQKAHERNESVIRIATAKVAMAITSSTLTTAGVFLPIAFVGGVLGDIFRPFAITIVVALMMSLLVALTVIPMLAKLLVLNNRNIKHHDENVYGKGTLAYKKVLEVSLRNPIKVLLASILLLVVSVAGTVPFLASSFMPESSTEKQMQFTVKLPRETSFETMDLKIREIEAMLGTAKDASGQKVFDYYESMVGYDQNSSSDERIDYYASIMAAVKPEQDAKKVAAEMTEAMRGMVPQGSEVEGSLMSSASTGTGADFAYLLIGEDINQLETSLQMVKQKLAEIPEIQEIKDNLSEKKLQVTVSVDQNKARLYGLSSAQITQTVAQWLSENEIGEIKFDNISYVTKIMVDEKFKNSLQAVGAIRLATPTGVTIALNEVAKVHQIDAPASVTREMQQQYVKVTAKIDSKDKGGVSAKATAALAELSLPDGIRTQVQGVSDDMAESFGQLVLAMIAAIMIVYLIMVIAFGNASAPFVIMFSLPFAAIGGFIGLFVTNESINITSLIGFLMLIGIVVANAIVLIDKVIQLREEGMGIREALLEGGLSRLRPIIMTAGATIVSQLPLALGLSEGTLISKGLAVVVIGGLTSSTLLTLVVVPVMYEIVEGMKARLSRMFNKKNALAEPNPTSIVH
ncbi:efflux RND transporter permease subunit [Paenibacillus sp. y28]|uniref:efflux RND transporter permease subunit n=1 Tax=Paenibacillus sp. y28 TaxID=3129110 RepID=UPI003019AF46